MERLRLQVQSPCLLLTGVHQSLGHPLVSQHSHAPETRKNLLKELELLRGLLWIKARHTCEVSVRLLQVCYHIVSYWIDHDGEHQRNVADCLLGSPSVTAPVTAKTSTFRPTGWAKMPGNRS